MYIHTLHCGVRSAHKFSKLSAATLLHNKLSSELTFENFCQGMPCAPPIQSPKSSLCHFYIVNLVQSWIVRISIFNQVMLNVADVRSAQVRIQKFTEILKNTLATTFTILKDSFSLSFSFSLSLFSSLSLCLKSKLMSFKCQ